MIGLYSHGTNSEILPVAWLKGEYKAQTAVDLLAKMKNCLTILSRNMRDWSICKTSLFWWVPAYAFSVPTTETFEICVSKHACIPWSWLRIVTTQAESWKRIVGPLPILFVARQGDLDRKSACKQLHLKKDLSKHLLCSWKSSSTETESARARKEVLSSLNLGLSFTQLMVPLK